MKILGQYRASGEYIKYVSHIEVFQFGDRLRDKDGFTQAVRDSYGDWVSPGMLTLGLKSKMEVRDE